MPPNFIGLRHDGAAGFFVDHDVFDRFATAHGNGFVHGIFERHGFAATELAISGDDGDRAGINNTFVNAFGRKAAKHHRVCHA